MRSEAPLLLFEDQAEEVLGQKSARHFREQHLHESQSKDAK